MPSGPKSKNAPLAGQLRLNGKLMELLVLAEKARSLYDEIVAQARAANGGEVAQTPNRVAEFRKARGLSLEQLGAAIDVHFTTIWKIEVGKAGASDAMKKKLADFFGKPVHEVFIYEAMGQPA